MPFTKFASFDEAQILGLKGTPSRDRTASLDKFSDYEDYRTEDGYLYARIRAISSRVNKNHDGWPSVELAGGEDAFNRHVGQVTGAVTVEADANAKYGYSTFLGKPIFIDHNNSDPDRARGVVVDAKLHVEDKKTAAELDPYYAKAPSNHLPPTWVELLLEVDAKSFPKLAKAIIDGSNDPRKGIDGFSMGCDVERSVCNICKNAATTPEDYCEHVNLKGAHFDTTDDSGRRTSKKSYEDCYGIKFFEISAVFDPADETALLREVRASVQTESGFQDPDAYPPDYDPEEDPFDRMRREQETPQAGIIACPDCHGTGGENGDCPLCGGVGQFAPPNPGTDMMGIPQGVEPEDTDPALADIGHELSQYPALMKHQGSFLKGAPDAGDDEFFGGKPGSATKAYKSMVDQYGEKKAEEVYYATRNKHKKGSMDDWDSIMDAVGAGQYGDPGDVRQQALQHLHDNARVIPCDYCDPNNPDPRCLACDGRGEYRPDGISSSDINHTIHGLIRGGEIPLRGTFPPPIAKVAQNPPPQSELLSVPEEVDTLRNEEVCPVCGSTMDDETCDVCGYIQPPEGFDNPDLEKAQENRDESPGEQESPGPEQGPEFQSIGEPAAQEPTSNPLATAHVRTDMSWNVSTPSRIAADIVPNQPDPTDEPDEEVLEDPQTPITSSVQTAQDFIAAANHPRRQMSQHTADAASGAPEAATPDVNTDVEGVGGVDEASNQEASQADAQVDTLGVGGTGVEGVSADQTVSVDQGDEHSKNIEAIPTKTWDNGSGVEHQEEPVHSQPFPATEDGVKSTSSWQVTALESQPFPRPEDAPYSEGEATVQGVQPADAVGRPDERVNVLDSTTTPENNSGATKTWSGTDGNGVLRQQDPTTNESLEGADGVKSARIHMFASYQLADLEIKLGMLEEAKKFQRIAELEQKPTPEVMASLSYAQRVKTAAHTGRLAGTQKSSKRLPVMGRKSSEEQPESTEEDPNAPGFAEAIFGS